MDSNDMIKDGHHMMSALCCLQYVSLPPDARPATVGRKTGVRSCDRSPAKASPLFRRIFIIDDGGTAVNCTIMYSATPF